jgi:hypothetical protein
VLGQMRPELVVRRVDQVDPAWRVAHALTVKLRPDAER